MPYGLLLFGLISLGVIMQQVRAVALASQKNVEEIMVEAGGGLFFSELLFAALMVVCCKSLSNGTILVNSLVGRPGWMIFLAVGIIEVVVRKTLISSRKDELSKN